MNVSIRAAHRALERRQETRSLQREEQGSLRPSNVSNKSPSHPRKLALKRVQIKGKGTAHRPRRKRAFHCAAALLQSGGIPQVRRKLKPTLTE
ncbi:hypothetical protein CesoFtcFv8_008283 [Champsocephalus esox]|uniref:Uncharacterized protein n=1 Tax=Champsocephalus esox TaxID=159716 RepID=A0AAN8H3Y8_9TELE|nr:hypothetical protein CesoFtcFv8_008283 [Champsocephalus esox]